MLQAAIERQIDPVTSDPVTSDWTTEQVLWSLVCWPGFWSNPEALQERNRTGQAKCRSYPAHIVEWWLRDSAGSSSLIPPGLPLQITDSDPTSSLAPGLTNPTKPIALMVISQQHLSAVLMLALCVAAADAAGGATVEHSLDGGHSFSTAGRIHLQDRDTGHDSAAVSGVFERQALSSSTLQQLEQLVEADRWG